MDLTGMCFEKIKVISLSHKDAKYRKYWNCECECGKITVVRGDCLTSKNTMSCGCYGKEFNKIRLMKIRTKHGECHTRIYSIWKGMRERCRKNYRNYEHVTVCSEWLDKENGFMNFYNWSMDNGYADNLTIDRINPFGDYSPENCRWATQKEQCRNKRDTLKIKTANGDVTMKEISEKIGVKYHTLYQRKKKLGWNDTQILGGKKI